jgi:aspartate oxidase
MTSDEITLKEYFEKLFEEKDRALVAALSAAEKAVAAALASAEKAVAVAEKNSEQWRAGANEWRAAMSDRENKFMNTEDRTGIEKEMKEFRNFMTTHNGTVQQIESLISDVKKLNTFKDNMAGKADQSSVTNATIFSILAAALGIISIVLNIIAAFKVP